LRLSSSNRKNSKDSETATNPTSPYTPPVTREMDVLCVYCFDVLVSELEKRSPIPFPAAHLAKTNPKLLTDGKVDDEFVSVDTH